MPKAFENCIKKGGKVRRKSFKDGKYINICYLNGKSYAGETHTALSESLEKGKT
jgi:putative hemolysin